MPLACTSNTFCLYVEEGTGERRQPCTQQATNTYVGSTTELGQLRWWRFVGVANMPVEKIVASSKQRKDDKLSESERGEGR